MTFPLFFPTTFPLFSSLTSSRDHYIPALEYHYIPGFFVHYIPGFSTTTFPLSDPSRPNPAAQRCVALRSAAQCFVTAAQEMHENKATRAPEKLVVTCSRKHVKTCRREGNRAGQETEQDVQDETGDARLAGLSWARRAGRYQRGEMCGAKPAGRDVRCELHSTAGRDVRGETSPARCA